MSIINLNEKTTQKYRKTKARIVAVNHSNRVYHFIKKYTMLDKQILKFIGKDNYKNFLFMINFAVNKFNRIDFDGLVEYSILSKSSIPRFRAILVKYGLVRKIKTTNGYGRYLNPMVQEIGNPNNDELFNEFKDITQSLYNINTNY